MQNNSKTSLFLYKKQKTKKHSHSKALVLLILFCPSVLLIFWGGILLHNLIAKIKLRNQVRSLLLWKFIFGAPPKCCLSAAELSRILN